MHCLFLGGPVLLIFSILTSGIAYIFHFFDSHCLIFWKKNWLKNNSYFLQLFLTCFITNIYIGHLCNHETLNIFNVLHIAFCHSWIVNSSSPSRLLVGITHFYFKRNLLLKLKKLTSGLLKNLEQNKWLLNLENFTSHCLKNPEILLVLLIGPLLIRPDCVYLVVCTICTKIVTGHP